MLFDGRAVTESDRLHRMRLIYHAAQWMLLDDVGMSYQFFYAAEVDYSTCSS
jgi:hypothetical protein